MTYKVLISDPLSHEGIASLLEAEDVEVDQITGKKEEELIEIIGQYDALLVRSQTKVTKNLLSHAVRLKVIGRAGVGVDNIDLNAATEQGVIVINAPDGNTISTAEHTFSMMMALARRIPQAFLSIKNGKWDRKSFVGVELSGKTLGIVGLGRIGTEVAKRAKAFNMNVLAFDPYLTPERAEKLGIAALRLPEVLEKADFITVHTPLTKETRHLIGKKEMERMKEGVYLLNCARGGIIDEGALLEAIQSGKVAGAALDVFEEEPATDHPLLQLPQVIATPHLGASTVEAQENVAIDVSHEILKVLRNEPYKNSVNLPSIPPHLMKKLESYLSLSEKMGLFLAQVTKGALKEVEISYAGELGEEEMSPLTRSILKGLLSYHLEARVNYVNALYLAKQRGILIQERKSEAAGGFANLITVKVKTEEGEHLVAGTSLNGYGARIVKVDGYTVDLAPTGHLIYVRHFDKPGVIGRVGSLLGSREVNIASMQVGRTDQGGNAIMLLTVDKAISDADAEALATLPEIASVMRVEL